ncbi:class V chitinase-like [Pistacia vera]|uniref:class V chitinase-like n=1 Tax=Pistacia vera TaxID=55513 RepID=UPI001262DB5F|nr:class V chitinase-like [Pistacia vera]
MVAKIITIVIFYIFFSIKLRPSIAQTNWIRVGYYRPSNEFPIPYINFTLFTHIICAYAAVNSTSYQLSLSPDDKTELVHVISSNYTQPLSSNLTSAHAALYDPSSYLNTDYGIRDWIIGGLSANKLVLSLPFYGSAWTLENPINNGIGAPAKGPAVDGTGFLTHKEIKNYTKRNGPDVHVLYNSTNVVNYWTKGTTWIGFDDVEAVRAKVAYA